MLNVPTLSLRAFCPIDAAFQASAAAMAFGGARGAEASVAARAARSLLEAQISAGGRGSAGRAIRTKVCGDEYDMVIAGPGKSWCIILVAHL